MTLLLMRARRARRTARPDVVTTSSERDILSGDALTLRRVHEARKHDEPFGETSIVKQLPEKFAD